MGRDSTAYCATCKEAHYLGYGSCSSWYDSAVTVAEYDEMAQLDPANQNLLKNKLLRAFLLLHEKHTILLASSDYTTVGANGLGRFYLHRQLHPGRVALPHKRGILIEKGNSVP